MTYIYCNFEKNVFTHNLPKRGFATRLTSGSTPETIPMSLKDSPMLLACNVE